MKQLFLDIGYSPEQLKLVESEWNKPSALKYKDLYQDNMDIKAFVSFAFENGLTPYTSENRNCILFKKIEGDSPVQCTVIGGLNFSKGQFELAGTRLKPEKIKFDLVNHDQWISNLQKLKSFAIDHRIPFERSKNTEPNWINISFNNPDFDSVLSNMLSIWFDAMGYHPSNSNSNSNSITTPIVSKGTVMNLSPLNQILYGPPGTGKTYHAIEAAVKAAEPQYYASLNIDTAIGTTPEQREALTEKYKELSDAGRIRFVTFHQSYGYEEFVEGLKAKTNDNDQISYAVEPGVFKTISEHANNSKYQKEFEINPNAKVWKISIDGTGQSLIRDECFKHNIAAIGWGNTGDLLNNADNEEGKAYHESLGPLNKSTLQEFSQGAQIGDLVLCIGSKREIQAVGIIREEYKYVEAGTSHREDYCHTLPINWLVTDININFYELNGNKDFTQKTFYHLWRFNVSDVFELLHKHNVNLEMGSKPTQLDNYVLIIDEINRGNISKIFGELITLIEPSKRSGEGQKESLELVLPYSGTKFSVPNNLHIIGTMNTADRSLAMMDTALRRRFDFVEMIPNTALFNGINVNGIDLERMLATMNKRIEVLYDREHTLGHAFFMPVKALVLANEIDDAFDELKSVFKNKIIPLLEEYFFEDWNKIRLVLGDNQKDESLRFITENKQSYDDIFGSNHGLDSYETESTTYALASFDCDDSVWNDPKAYIGIYPKEPAKLVSVTEAG